MFKKFYFFKTFLKRTKGIRHGGLAQMVERAESRKKSARLACARQRDRCPRPPFFSFCYFSLRAQYDVLKQAFLILDPKSQNLRYTFFFLLFHFFSFCYFILRAKYDI